MYHDSNNNYACVTDFLNPSVKMPAISEPYLKKQFIEQIPVS